MINLPGYATVGCRIVMFSPPGEGTKRCSQAICHPRHLDLTTLTGRESLPLHQCGIHATPVCPDTTPGRSLAVHQRLEYLLNLRIVIVIYLRMFLEIPGSKLLYRPLVFEINILGNPCHRDLF